MKPQLRKLLPISLLCALSAPAFASHYYVDAVSGSDANGGGSQLDAWRTIAHAVAVIPDAGMGSHAIHLAPGTYGKASGEVFPLWMRPGVRLVGTEGSASTILEGPAYWILAFIVDGPGSPSFDARSGAEGLTLRDATHAIYANAASGSASPAFRDVVVRSCEAGAYFVGSMHDGVSVGSVAPSFERATIEQCNVGIQFFASGTTWFDLPKSALSLADCTVRDCGTDGVAIYASYAVVDATLVRSRFTGNGGSGVFAVADHGWGLQARGTIDARDSLFAANGDAGVRMIASDDSGASMNAKHCTFADNALYGAVLTQRRGGLASACIGNSVLSGNATDLKVASVIARHSDSADGALLGQRGCIAADPLFVDSAGGDYRLAFGSPCIDSGDPAFTTTTDLLACPHGCDGNLDARGVPDMGAIEFTPLAVASIDRAGKSLVLELWGPDSARAIVYASGSPLLAMPDATPYGSSYLEQGTEHVVAQVRLQSGTPKRVEFAMPEGAVPSESPMAFQAMISSSASPAGAAWTNPMQMNGP